MESTRIPKPSGLKPPTTRLPTAGPKSLAPIQEKKPVIASSSSSSSRVPPVTDFRRNALRRRSKSVTDLRPTASKFSAAGPKPVVKTTALKRPLDGKNDEETKPMKIAKTKKIPDWDYKSRFLEIQKKYSAMVGDVKTMKSKLEDLPQIEREMDDLKSNNSKQRADIDGLKTTIRNLTGEKKNLTEENNQIRTNFSELTNTYSNLQTLHERLKCDFEKSAHRIDTLEKKNSILESKHCNISEENERLKSSNEKLESDMEEHETLRRMLHNTIQNLKGNIRVFCRVRPAINAEEQDKLQCSMFYPDESTMEIRKSRESVSLTGKPGDFKQEFSFDKVFPPQAQQNEVFEELSELVQSALDGYHVCVFAYGQTGSGKTYTMQGTDEHQGMIPRTIDLIFEKKKKMTALGWTYDVFASFLEIYNEAIKDLLAPNSSLPYETRFNEGRGVTVTNLKTVPITSADALKKLMDEAQKNRAVAATDFNLHSSRSHSITKISLEGYNKQSQITFSGSIHLVDLAGSESAKTSSGDRLVETKSINRSLTELGMVMLALHNKERHVPYRNSKLTFLLQSCLGGNSKTLMFVNIAPFEECYGGVLIR